jgi:hypothetical protein
VRACPQSGRSDQHAAQHNTLPGLGVALVGRAVLVVWWNAARLREPPGNAASVAVAQDGGNGMVGQLRTAWDLSWACYPFLLLFLLLLLLLLQPQLLLSVCRLWLRTAGGLGL